MKKLIIIASSIFILSSCEKDAEQTVNSTNNEFKVELLFTVDGVKVYRFEDRGSFKYFTNTSGNTNWSETHGKQTYDVEVMNNVTDSIQ